MRAYYNEHDLNAAQWLRNLIAAGHIAPGDVDTRSIEDVTPNDLKGYTQCHFFAGIGVWSYALRRAGWDDARQVWTGSCPCQPFSAAGKGSGFADERHLWPAWHWLIEACRPAVVFGEQVASKDGLTWLDLVYSDLEGARYAVQAADICAAGVGAPHIRQRLYFVAVSNSEQRNGRWNVGTARRDELTNSGAISVVANADGGDASTERIQRSGQHGQQPKDAGACNQIGRAGPVNGEWGRSDWLLCRDNKWRPVEPGTFPLVNGATGRMGRLRAYGNAIVAPLAIEFIEAYLST